MLINTIINLTRKEAASGVILGLVAILAIIVVNSPLDFLYQKFLTTTVAIQIGEFIINKPLLLWINDGLMVVFFLYVGLEIKREIFEGELSTKEQATLPFVAACGGLIFPAIIYTFINWDYPKLLHGWAVPAATDIAFALAVVTLLGKRVPKALKVCLVAIAIIDDLAAIIIIATFYTKGLSLITLSFGLIALVFLYLLNRKGVTRVSPYVLAGIFLWACVLKSGVHATLAGVVLAFFIPLKAKTVHGLSPAKELEKGLHHWVIYFILPVFAFANAGVTLDGLSLDVLFEPIALGIILGLFIGKQLGVMLFTAISVKAKICTLPKGVSWPQYYAMSVVTGVGFTMSLFIGTLAFDNIGYITEVRNGVIVGSLLSGTVGYLLLRATTK